MVHIESTLVVPQSLEDVFAFLNTCESHLQFIPRMINLDQTSPGAFGQVGTRLTGRLNYFGIRIPVQYEIIEMEANHRLAMKGRLGLFTFKDGYVLERNGKGTEIRFWLELASTGWMRVFSPLMGFVARIHAWETLRNLRRELGRQEIASPLRRSQ
jgi:hypothetical protein